MQLPESIQSLLTRYVAQYPIPTGEPGEAHEEHVRQWSIRFAEQVAYSEGKEWGMKRADPNRPISKDTLSRYAGGKLLIWDLLIGTGTGNPRLNPNPESDDVTGQVFEPVMPRNHLDAITPSSTPLPPLPPADLGPVMAKLADLDARLDQQNATWNALQPTLQAVIVELQAIRDRVEVLTEKQVRIPDATIRIGGRVVATVDNPD